MKHHFTLVAAEPVTGIQLGEARYPAGQGEWWLDKVLVKLEALALSDAPTSSDASEVYDSTEGFLLAR
jgi:hypothetical protein